MLQRTKQKNQKNKETDRGKSKTKKKVYLVKESDTRSRCLIEMKLFVCCLLVFVFIVVFLLYSFLSSFGRLLFKLNFSWARVKCAWKLKTEKKKKSLKSGFTLIRIPYGGGNALPPQVLLLITLGNKFSKTSSCKRVSHY